jgi:iron complex transport system permease protein
LTASKTLLLLGLLLAFALLVHIGVGSSFWYSPLLVAREIIHGPMADATPENNIIWNLRLPRALEGMLVGAILGMVGSAFQAQFRNPLADPYIVGVSSGAAVGGVVALVLGLASVWMVGFGFLSGLAALGIVYALAMRRGLVSVPTLLLAGVSVGSLLSAVTSLILLGAGQDTNRVLAWLLGNLTTAQWPQILMLAVAAAAGGSLLIANAGKFNAVAFGEDTASRLGVDVARFRTLVLIVSTAMTAVAVGSVGIIGFLGLVAPHISRRLVGVDWRWSLAGSGLVGGVLLLLADIVAQRGMSVLTQTPGMEIPVGIVTALVGAPSLITLLRKSG